MADPDGLPASVFAPVSIGALRLPHRIAMGAMHLGYEAEPDAGPRLAAFYRERARGGAGLICTGGWAVSADGAADRSYGIVDERGARRAGRDRRRRRGQRGAHRPAALPRRPLRRRRRSGRGRRPLAAAEPADPRRAPGARRGRGLGGGRASSPPAAARRQGARLRGGRGDGLGGLPGRPVPLAGDQPARGLLGRRRRAADALRDRGRRARSAPRSARASRSSSG